MKRKEKSRAKLFFSIIKIFSRFDFLKQKTQHKINNTRDMVDDFSLLNYQNAMNYRVI